MFDPRREALAYMAEMMGIDEHEIVADQGANQTFRHMVQFARRSYGAGLARAEELARKGYAESSAISVALVADAIAAERQVKP